MTNPGVRHTNDPTPADDVRVRVAVLLIALAGVLAWALASPPLANDLVGGDEGYYGTMARNVLADPRQLLTVSLSPLGGPGDKPPLVPALLALAMRCFGTNEAALRALSLASAFVVIAGSATLARRLAGSRAGIVGALLLVTLPWLADASRVVAAELPLAALGVLALVVLSGGAPTPRRAVLAGALLGAAFLCKLWLVALLAVPAALLAWPNPRALVALIASAAFVGALHLAAVAWLAPATLDHWLAITFGSSLVARAGGAGYAAYWKHGALYYALMVAKAWALALPLVALGAWALLRRIREPLPRAVLAWAAGLIPLSAFAIKSGGYAYPVVPAFGVLAACGAAALLRMPRAFVRVLAWALVGIAVVGGAARIAQRLPLRYHDTGYRAIAAWLAPRLADAPPTERVLLAPEAPAFQFYLFRTAGYWGTPIVPWTPARLDSTRADARLRAFVVDPTARAYGGWPDAPTLAWLEQETHEVTHEIETAAGRRLAMRVFVRAGDGPARTP